MRENTRKLVKQREIRLIRAVNSGRLRIRTGVGSRNAVTKAMYLQGEVCIFTHVTVFLAESTPGNGVCE